MELFTNDSKIKFDGFEHFQTDAAKHGGLIRVCFGAEKIKFTNPKTGKSMELTQVEIKYDEVEKTVPEYWTYHDYNRENGRNIVLTIYNK